MSIFDPVDFDSVGFDTFTAPLADPFGFILTTIRSDPGVFAISAGRWSSETGKGWDHGPASYQAFGILTLLGRSRLKRAPIQEVRLLAKCYGANRQLASAHAMAVSAAIHATGRRISTGGVAIFGTFDDGGDGAGTDPEPPNGNGQPYDSVIIQVNAYTGLLV
jgi:hypothetical protein